MIAATMMSHVVLVGLLPILIATTSVEPVHQPTKEQRPLERRQSGSWSSWSSWSPCSSTCGPGVSSQTRSCLLLTSSDLSLTRKSNDTATSRSSECVGISSRYIFCQQQPCLDKAQQPIDPCSKFNKQPFRKRFYIWETYFKGDCEVKCRPSGEQLLLTLSTSFQDGTPCSDSTLEPRVCVQGVCKVIGCDGVIGSNAKLDKCGICGGDNSTCQTISGFYTRLTHPVGYNVIAQLPTGACNVSITELRVSRNYLALRTQKNGYIINGNWAINWSGEYEAAGTVFNYRRHDLRTQTGERITARGPLDQVVELLLIYQEPNTGIKYEYSLPVNRVPAPKQLDGKKLEPTVNLVEEETPIRKKHQRRTHHTSREQHHYSNDRIANAINHRRRRREYRWHVIGLGECSKTCGGGVQVTVVACIRRKMAVTVEDHHCHGERKPEMQNVICNTQPCPARWRSTEWSVCSQTCGPGTQTRDVLCVQDSVTKVQESSCPEESRPKSVRPCQIASCYEWKRDEWSQCSGTCSEARRRRQVRCISGQGEVAADEKCNAQKPDEEEKCTMGSCGVTWFFTDWDNACSSQCTSGVQTRKIFCSGDADACANEVKPISSQACTNASTCGSKWFFGEWSKCPVMCGTGQQTREVVCLELTSQSDWRVSTVTTCLREDRPISKQTCNNNECSAVWYTSDWTPCSKTCGTGEQSRKVMCLDNNQQESQECPLEKKPLQQQPCSVAKCQSPQSGTECVDKYNNCLLVVRARLCSYNYYKILCCSSCRT